MGEFSIDAIKRIFLGTPGEAQSETGALKADNTEDGKKFKQELIAAAYNGASGYVAPPASNIMGFGPAANKDVT